MAKTPKIPKGPGSGKKVAPQALLDKSVETRIKPGEVKNPYGRKGKDGMGGVSLKKEFKAFLNRMTTEERDAVWMGLMTKAMMGDVPATKLWVELNDEQVNEQRVEAEAGAQIVINIPTIEEA